MLSSLRKLGRLISYWFHREQRERELREEIEEHRRMRGGVTSVAGRVEESRGVWIPVQLGDLAQDLRYGARQLRHNPMFTLVAVAGLALAIGLATAVFSVVEAAFWRPLPVKEGDRVVVLMKLGRLEPSVSTFSEDELRHYRTSGALEEVTGVALDDRLVANWPQENAPRAVAAFVTPDYFRVLGGKVLAGRLLSEDEGDTSVLIRESSWRRRLSARADVVGSKLLLNGFPFTVVGVVADEAMAASQGAFDVMLPLRAAALLRVPEAASRLRLVGRIRKETSLEQTQVALGVAAQQWLLAHPQDKNVYRPQAVPARLASGRRGGWEATDFLLPVAVLLVLLIACANLTNLLLARAEARRREMAVRLSLGASRGRLVRQLLTECFLLTTAAGLLGMVCASSLLRAVLWAFPLVLPPDALVPWLDVSINARVFAATLGLCALTTVLFGLAPALEATRVDVAGSMKEGAGRRRFRGVGLRDLLIAAQMAACVVLLVVTASLYRSMAVLDDFLTALDAGAVVQTHLYLPGYGYQRVAAQAFADRVRLRMKELPDVEAAGFTRFPLVRQMGAASGVEMEIEGRAGRVPGAGLTGFVSDGTLPVFGQRLVGGRDFTAEESRTGAAVVLINEPMARGLFAGSAVGRRMRVWTKGKPEAWQEIVGVMAEKPLTEEGTSGYSVLRPLGAAENAFLQVRSRGDRGAAMLAVRRVMTELDPRISANVRSAQEFVDLGRMGPRLVAGGALVVALASLAMAAIGLYGVTAYVAGRRTKEIGIRMALGARPGDVLRMVARQGVALVASGLAVGLVLALVVERLLSAGVRLMPASGAVTYLGVGLFLGTVALLAMMVPSVRAARVNPTAALRHDG